MALLATGLGAAIVAAAPPAAATPVPGPVTFTYTGAEQTYPIPAGATSLEILAVGASADSGGAGAVVTATIPIPPATPTLYVEVGGLAPGLTPVLGGGGIGDTGAQVGNNGAGASDVQTCSMSDTACTTTITG